MVPAPRTRRTAALAAVLLLAAAVPASAEWEDPQFLFPRSATDDAIGPDVGIDNAGRALATWLQTSDPTTATQWRAHAAHLPVQASAWTLLPPLSPAGARPGNTALGVAGGGAAVAAWTQGTNGVLHAARGSTTSGAFGSPMEMGGFGCPNNPSQYTDDHVVGPVVALGDGGSGHIAWTAPCGNTDNGRWVLFRQITNDGFASTTKSAGHNDPTALGGPVGPQLAPDPATGGSRALFKEAEFPSPLVSRDLVNNDTVGAKQEVVADSSAFQEHLGFLPDGKQVVVYRTAGTIRALVDGTNTKLSPDGQDALDPQLAVSADGTVVAAWFGDGAFWAAVRHPTEHTWGPAHQLSDDVGEPRDLTIGVSDEGTAYAIWRRDPGDFVDIEGSILDPDDATRSPGTPFQFQPVPETVYEAGHEQLDGGPFSGDAETPQVAVNATGSAIVVFRFVIEVGNPDRWAIGWARFDRSQAFHGDPPPPDDPGPPPPPPGGDPPAGGAPPPGAVPPRDTRGPLLSAFTLSQNVIALGAKEGKMVARAGEWVASGRKLRVPLRVGTKVRWTADEAGTATITVRHAGCFTFRYVGDSVTRKERCPRTKDGVVYTDEVPSKVGGNTLRYRGQTDGGKRLRVGGRYQMTLSVTDAAGNVSRVRSAKFRVDELARPQP
ncbi:MAG TPA: hypothetical protein VF549_16015 [Solirubrobacteraceae bacterium]|jgi:hypothetical protein